MSKFSEDLTGAIYELFRGTFSQSMNQNQVDSLHLSSKKLSNAIAKEAEKVALERCKKLSDATQKAFALMAEDLEKASADITARFQNQNSQIDIIANRLDVVIDSYRELLSALRGVSEKEDTANQLDEGEEETDDV